jgi:hypothetical protein
MATTKMAAPEAELDDFIAKYSPEIAAAAHEALTRMRARLPGATELVYDNYNALAIGFGPTERAADAVFSIAVFPRWVSLFFLQGTRLADPYRLLTGSGKQARHVVLEDPADLDSPALQALMAQALTSAATPFDDAGVHRIVIKSISVKQRPRRPVKET